MSDELHDALVEFELSLLDTTEPTDNDGPLTSEIKALLRRPLLERYGVPTE